MGPGELAERLIVGVVAPLLVPADLADQRREVSFAPRVTVHRRLVGRLQLLKAKRERHATGEQLLQQAQLQILVAANGVGLADVHDVGLGQIGDDLLVSGFLAAGKVDPALRRAAVRRRDLDRGGAGRQQREGQQGGGCVREPVGIHWERNPRGRSARYEPCGRVRGVTVTSVVSLSGAGPPRSYSSSTR